MRKGDVVCIPGPSFISFCIHLVLFCDFRVNQGKNQQKGQIVQMSELP
jgi:hypothetical protein